MHLACENGDVPVMRELLKCGCKIECTNLNGETPLLRAVKSGNILVTKLLINHGADVSASDQVRLRLTYSHRCKDLVLILPRKLWSGFSSGQLHAPAEMVGLAIIFFCFDIPVSVRVPTGR